RDRTVTGVQTCALPIFRPCPVEQPELSQQLVRSRLAHAWQYAVVGGMEDEVVANRQRPVEVVALRNDRQLPARLHGVADDVDARSEERRVGKEGRSRGG